MRAVDGRSRLSRTSDGHSFFRTVVVCGRLSRVPPVIVFGFVASNRMAVVSPCSLASHIGGVGVRDAVAIAIGLVKVRGAHWAKTITGAVNHTHGDWLCVRRSRKDESFARETTSHSDRGKLERERRDGQRS